MYSAYKFRKSESEFAQSGLTLCDPMDCSLPGSPIHGILQARILEWVAISCLSEGDQKSQNTGREHSTTHKQKIGLNIDWAYQAQEGLEELFHVEGQEGQQ